MGGGDFATKKFQRVLPHFLLLLGGGEGGGGVSMATRVAHEGKGDTLKNITAGYVMS